MIHTSKPLFNLGQVVATPGALDALGKAGQSPSEFLDRHVRGDWGNLCAEDSEENTLSLKDGSRILSVYHTKSEDKIWIITEAADEHGQRAATTLLLPSEY